MIKLRIQNSYSTWAHMSNDMKYLNWGLWDKKIYNEYSGLNFNYSALCPGQDLYSQLLLYYLIRPLIKNNYYNKRLLDIGCGNGIGLKVSSELLKSKYALGVDLVCKSLTKANINFYKEDRVNYIQSDAEILPIKNEIFDIVMNLESSHLYPQIECFFSEVERVLAPGGFFCYADIHFDYKKQTERLEAFLKTRKNLKVIQKNNITKMVKSSIHHRLILNEDAFYRDAMVFFDNDKNKLISQIAYLFGAKGLAFLPWWKIWFKNPELRWLGKDFRQVKYPGKKYYFYYLIQKDR